MTWASRIKLAVGLIATVAIVAVCTLVFNQRQNSAQSTSAAIVAERYPVGTDYGGIVTQQFALPGDVVRAGDPLFELRSLALQRDVASGHVVDPEVAAADGTSTVVATVDGTLADVEVPQGGFARAGSVLAVIDRAGSLAVDADFLLSARDYARITADAEAELLLPNRKTLTGTVSRIDVATLDGNALSTVRISSDQLTAATASGVFQPGTPVVVTLRLRDDGPLAGVSDAFGDLLRQVGL